MLDVNCDCKLRLKIMTVNCYCKPRLQTFYVFKYIQRVKLTLF